MKHDIHFKEADTSVTISRLRGICNENNISLEEKWCVDSEAGTSSLRVSIADTFWGSNGKGVSKDYARASAYAELFERMQNGLFFVPGEKHRQAMFKEFGFAVAPDECYLTSNELINQGGSFIEQYFIPENRSKLSVTEKANVFSSVNVPDTLDGRYICLPYYSCKFKRFFYLPWKTMLGIYGSNGMAAGNSMEEAMVQGLSEIIERVVQKKLFSSNQPLPLIREEYLAKYPYIYEMYKNLCSDPKYDVAILDCSLGGKYPVAGLRIIEKNTGRYGIKVGCHPEYSIAIERAITEAGQGGLISDYCNRSYFDYLNRSVLDMRNIMNSYKFGKAQYPHQIVISTEECSEPPFVDKQALSNKEILLSWIDSICNYEGYDVLCRDVSYLEFPSCHIIIPGLSEIAPSTDMYLRGLNTEKYVRNLLHDTSTINSNNAKYINAYINYAAGNFSENRLRDLYSIDLSNTRLPYEYSKCELIYLSAMCDVVEKEFLSAAHKVRFIATVLSTRPHTRREAYLSKAISIYLEGMHIYQDHRKIMSQLENLFTDEILLLLDEYFADCSKTIEKQYPNQQIISDAKSGKVYIRSLKLMKALYKKHKTNPVSQHAFVNLVFGEKALIDVSQIDVFYNDICNGLRTIMSEEYLFERDTILTLLNGADTKAFPRDALNHDIGTIGKVILSAMETYTV